jgi:hypothetical protein
VPAGGGSSSGQRRDAFGDEVHAQGQEQHRHRGIVVRDEPTHRRVGWPLRAIPADEVGETGTAIVMLPMITKMISETTASLVEGPLTASADPVKARLCDWFSACREESRSEQASRSTRQPASSAAYRSTERTTAQTGI